MWFTRKPVPTSHFDRVGWAVQRPFSWSRRGGGQLLEVLQHPLAVSDLARVED
jgi:hypothetical protein